jgi:hypothetical protein
MTSAAVAAADYWSLAESSSHPIHRHCTAHKSSGDGMSPEEREGEGVDSSGANARDAKRVRRSSSYSSSQCKGNSGGSKSGGTRALLMGLLGDLAMDGVLLLVDRSGDGSVASSSSSLLSRLGSMRDGDGDGDFAAVGVEVVTVKDILIPHLNKQRAGVCLSDPPYLLCRLIP